MYGFFYMMHSLFKPTNPAKEFWETWARRRAGQEALRKAYHELARLEQDRPKHETSIDGLLKLSHDAGLGK